MKPKLRWTKNYLEMKLRLRFRKLEKKPKLMAGGQIGDKDKIKGEQGKLEIKLKLSWTQNN